MMRPHCPGAANVPGVPEPTELTHVEILPVVQPEVPVAVRPFGPGGPAAAERDRDKAGQSSQLR